jgi:hypothetical protein
MNWHRGLWRAALGLLGLAWLVVLAMFMIDELPGFALGGIMARMAGLSLLYLAGCKLIEWIALGFGRRT